MDDNYHDWMAIYYWDTLTRRPLDIPWLPLTKAYHRSISHPKENEMNIIDAFPSKYIKASDLQGREVQVTINSVDMATFDNGDESKPCVYFQGKKKGLILNKTNANTIIDIYGPDTDYWHGKQITIFPTQTVFKGATTDCIRVKTAPRQIAPPGFAAPQQAAQPEFAAPQQTAQPEYEEQAVAPNHGEEPQAWQRMTRGAQLPCGKATPICSCSTSTISFGVCDDTARRKTHSVQILR